MTSQYNKQGHMIFMVQPHDLMIVYLVDSFHAHAHFSTTVLAYGHLPYALFDLSTTDTNIAGTRNWRNLFVAGCSCWNDCTSGLKYL